jgi:hypothetical protein
MTRRHDSPDAGTRRSLQRCLLLIGFPLGVRLLCLAELQRNPYFRVPLVDALTNHRAAASLAAGTFRLVEPFWQPPFYQYFLGFLYKLMGPSPLGARLVQALLGSISCWLLYRVTDRLVGRPAAWTAWACAALCGPLIFFDLQLLNAGLAAFLLLLSVERMTAASAESRAAWGVAGAAVGLACITVATCLPVLAWMTGWLWWQLRGRTAPAGANRPARLGPGRTAGRPLALFLACALVPIMVVAAANFAVSHEPILISYNGGINYWIGNNPDYDRTVAIRPGRSWDSLIAQTTAAGVTGAAGTSSYWLRRSLAWQRAHPGAWLRLLARKTQLYLRGDEIPRNTQIYPFRTGSLVLRCLLWVHGLAFPLGLILPLAAAGLVSWGTGARRTGGEGGLGLIAGIILIWSLTIVTFFIASRYRLPAVPYLILFAALGVVRWRDAIRRRAYRTLILPGVVLIAFGILCNGALPTPPRQFDSDTYVDLGVTEQDQGRTDEAVGQYELALKLRPDNPEAANNLGCILLARGRLGEAEPLFRRVLDAYPGDPMALLNLGAIYYQRREPYPAGHCARLVIESNPSYPNAASYLHAAEAMAGQLEAARLQSDPEIFLDQLLQLLAESPTNDFLFERLKALLEQRGDAPRARRMVETKLAVAPTDPGLLQLKARVSNRVGGP